MRFSVLSFVGLASAAAIVTPRADYGYWDVSVVVDSYANGYHSEAINATYHNSELAEPITASCSDVYNPQADPKETNSCTDPSFSWSRSSESVSLTQTVELSGEQVTVRGEGALSLKCDPVRGRYCTGESRVDVSTAVA